MTAKPLTGRKVFAITAGAFGIIIAVNVSMAFFAVSTFPGLETKNSYVASQKFDADRQAQLALGWQTRAGIEGDTVFLAFTDMAGNPVRPENLTTLLGRTTVRSQDREPDFEYIGGRFVAQDPLAPGKWELRVNATAPDGTVFRQRLELFKADNS
ncbi:MAG: FixH family protein [Brevirhabdus sp.]